MAAQRRCWHPLSTAQIGLISVRKNHVDTVQIPKKSEVPRLTLRVDRSIVRSIGCPVSHDRQVLARMSCVARSTNRSIDYKVVRLTCAFKTCSIFSWHGPLQLIYIIHDVFSGLILIIRTCFQLRLENKT